MCVQRWTGMDLKWQNQLANNTHTNRHTHTNTSTHTQAHTQSHTHTCVVFVELESQEKHLVDDENHGNINDAETRLDRTTESSEVVARWRCDKQKNKMEKRQKKKMKTKAQAQNAN